MDQSTFGTWGAGLSADEFAKALAQLCLIRFWPPETVIPTDELHAVAGDPEAQPPLQLIFARHPRDWQAALMPDAASLARFWNYHFTRAEFEYRPPLSADDEDAPRWILRQLQHPAVQLRSVYLKLAPSSQIIAWKWPMRAAVLSDNTPESLGQLLQSAPEKTSFVGPLTRITNMQTARGTQELLFLPGNLEQAVTALKKTAAPIHAFLVVVLGGAGSGIWGQLIQYQEQLRQMTQAEGVLLTHSKDPATWFADFLANLAHNATLDVAALDASRQSADECILWTSRELLRQSTVFEFAKRLVARGKTLPEPRTKVVISSEAASRIGIPPVPMPVDAILKTFEDGLRIGGINWLHETDGATVVSAISTAMEEITQRKAVSAEEQLRSYSFQRERIRSGDFKAPSTPPKPRFLKAAAYLESGSSLLRVRESFSAEHSHVIEVSIGPSDALSLQLPKVFPDDLLPEAEDGHMLTVVFHEPRLMDEPQLQTLYLPKQRQSPTCRFHLPPPGEQAWVEARITVLHENRVLQTAIIKGRVARLTTAQIDRLREPDRRPDSALDANAIRLDELQAVAPASGDLNKRSRFTTALVLNHAEAAAGVTAVAGYQAAYVRLNENAILGKARKIDKLLNRSDWDEPAYQRLDSQNTADLLRNLAYQGLSLRSALVDQFGPFLAEAGRVQVVSARAWSRLPVEFIYDFEFPEPDAPVCPNAQAALTQNPAPAHLNSPACMQDCPPRSKVVCPLGFWCMNRVIEWHAFAEKHVSRMSGAEFLIETQDSGRSGILQLLRNPLVGYTSRVTDADPKSIDSLKQRFQMKPVVVQSWKDWRSQVSSRAPTFLMLLIHTEHNPKTDSPDMELGGAGPDRMLSTLQLKREDVCAVSPLCPPLLLLLGCNTGVEFIQFDSVAAAFANKGAAIVVSTNAEVYAPIAATIGGIFVEHLQGYTDGESFGDLMLRVRRKALSQGQAMVLCLNTYGDADWKLTRYLNAEH